MFEKGPFRSYKVLSPQIFYKLSKSDLPFINLLILVSLVKFYQLYHPGKVVFDEVHFVSYVNNYFTNEFYIDVHPPLGKLIYYYIARLSGYIGDEHFSSIGDVYSTFPFLNLRIFVSLISLLTSLMTYLISRLYLSPLKSFIVSFLFAFETSFFTNSRFILLDPLLILGQSVIIYSLKKTQGEKVFTSFWYSWLLVLGIAVGYTISIKLSGLFIWAWVLIIFSIDFWNVIGDLSISTLKCFQHLFITSFNLILIPLSIYCYIFSVHFDLLTNQGKDAVMVGSQFRSTFHDYQNQPVEVYYGSTITMKHLQLEKFLHSHDAKYPNEPNLQQVTLYDYENYNNEWVIESKFKYNESKLMFRAQPVKDGDVVRLYHKSTGKYLHVNKGIPPPISEKEYNHQVNCNATRGLLGDEEYEFKVRIVMKSSSSKNLLPMIKLRTTESYFQLIHRNSKCLLYSHNTRLPEWGYNHNEVMCIEEPTIPNSLWYIETNQHPLLNETSANTKMVEFDKMTLLKKIYQLHKTMMKLNSSFNLRNNPNSSSPISWPLSLKGILMFSNVDLEDQSQIYYMGTLPIYTFGIILVICSIINITHKTLRYNLNMYSLVYKPIEFEYLLGFILNYVPYLFMDRNLYLHHYLPALYFIILMMSKYFNSERYMNNLLLGSLLIVSLFWFVIYSPLTFGTGWTFDSCKQWKLFSSWSYNCATYL